MSANGQVIEGFGEAGLLAGKPRPGSGQFGARRGQRRVEVNDGAIAHAKHGLEFGHLHVALPSGGQRLSPGGRAFGNPAFKRMLAHRKLGTQMVALGGNLVDGQWERQLRPAARKPFRPAADGRQRDQPKHGRDQKTQRGQHHSFDQGRYSPASRQHIVSTGGATPPGESHHAVFGCLIRWITTI